MNDDEKMLPLIACDRILFTALSAVWRDSKLLSDLGTLFLCDDAGVQSRTLFNYLFIDAECSVAGVDYRVVGYRLRNREDRLRYAQEHGLTLKAEHGGPHADGVNDVKQD